MISWFERHNRISWIIVFVIAITIFYVSSLTFEQVPRAFRINWKTIAYHFGIYLFLSFFINISLVKGRVNNIALVLPATLGAIVYGLFDEIHQLFVQGRACTFSDWMIDSGGALLACFVYLLWVRVRRETNKYF